MLKISINKVGHQKSSLHHIAGRKKAQIINPQDLTSTKETKNRDKNQDGCRDGETTKPDGRYHHGLNRRETCWTLHTNCCTSIRGSCQ